MVCINLYKRLWRLCYIVANVWPLFHRWLRLKWQCVQFRWLFHRSEHLRGYRTYRCWNGPRVALWSLAVKLLYSPFTLSLPRQLAFVHTALQFCLNLSCVWRITSCLPTLCFLDLWWHSWCPVGVWPCRHLNLCLYACYQCLLLSVWNLCLWFWISEWLGMSLFVIDFCEQFIFLTCVMVFKFCWISNGWHFSAWLSLKPELQMAESDNYITTLVFIFPLGSLLVFFL